mmetsp:Transcript_5614/g.16718  ORF Transcript_5614/g.16718 Transcript_5614/m.16718 type:complete len:152 (+) Transcript_5614:102-557(+)
MTIKPALWSMLVVAAIMTQTHAASCQIIRDNCQDCQGTGTIRVRFFMDGVSPETQEMPVATGDSRVYNSGFLPSVPTSIVLRTTSTNGVGLQSIVCRGLGADIASTNFGGVFWVDKTSAGTSCSVTLRRVDQFYFPVNFGPSCDPNDVNHQ